jgi:hypothetical protein
MFAVEKNNGLWRLKLLGGQARGKPSNVMNGNEL